MANTKKSAEKLSRFKQKHLLVVATAEVVSLCWSRQHCEVWELDLDDGDGVSDGGRDGGVGDAVVLVPTVVSIVSESGSWSQGKG